MSDLFVKGELTEKEKQVLEYIKNNNIFRSSDEQAILRKAFYMLREMECEIVPSDESLLNPSRFLVGLSDAEKDFVVIQMSLGMNSQIKIPYLVRTPRPYVICLRDFRNDIERKERIKQLEAKVENLRGIMIGLGITEEEGGILGLSLNGNTRNRLMDIAWGQYSYANSIGQSVNAEKLNEIYNILKENKHLF